jgi:2-polyprenyl-3-methyl-5-hydroxy-6-metoxy-1,4-benzoquinol methylase
MGLLTDPMTRYMPASFPVIMEAAMSVDELDEVAVEVDRYVLGTGEAGAARLRILHRAYGPGTRRFLGLAGLKPGMRVADIGCGVGQVTVDLAELVGVKGTWSG